MNESHIFRKKEIEPRKKEWDSRSRCEVDKYACKVKQKQNKNDRMFFK